MNIIITLHHFEGNTRAQGHCEYEKDICLDAIYDLSTYKQQAPGMLNMSMRPNTTIAIDGCLDDSPHSSMCFQQDPTMLYAEHEEHPHLTMTCLPSNRRVP